MSYEEYRIGQHLCKDYNSDDFYGLIQGCMRLADDNNLSKLKSAFPEQWTELQARYNASGGRLKGEECPSCEYFGEVNKNCPICKGTGVVV
jgi:hypothetical protein